MRRLAQHQSPVTLISHHQPLQNSLATPRKMPVPFEGVTKSRREITTYVDNRQTILFLSLLQNGAMP
jgi:hypothetical protein